MIRTGLLQLAPDAGDGRRSLIELAAASHAAMSDYLSEVRDTWPRAGTDETDPECQTHRAANIDRKMQGLGDDTLRAARSIVRPIAFDG